MVDGTNLWLEEDPAVWLAALAEYERVVEAQGSERLVELDGWYHRALPAILVDRDPPYLTLDELVLIVKWKMTRGEWRPRNLSLVEANDPLEVEAVTRDAFLFEPGSNKPIALISKLKGVGPATASAALAAYAPADYPFFDEVAAALMPGFDHLKYTAGEYARFADLLRQCAARLNAAAADAETPPNGWTAHTCGLALWSWAGGKAGRAALG